MRPKLAATPLPVSFCTSDARICRNVVEHYGDVCTTCGQIARRRLLVLACAFALLLALVLSWIVGWSLLASAS